MTKIINEFNQEQIIKDLKIKNKKIVLCHGVFDLFHVGHLGYLKEAKKLGDILIVSVTTDKYVIKAPGRPYFKLKQRMSLIASLEIVDYVLASDFETAENVIKLIKPNIYFKGSDYKNNKKDITNNIKREISITNKFKGKVLYSSTDVYSSSLLLNNNNVDNNVDNYDVKKFVEKLKKKYSFDFINNIINKASKISVLVVGEAIFDKFTFCNYLGASGKENIATVQKIGEKIFLGGSLSLAKNVSALANKVAVCSVLGNKKNDLNFIKKNIFKNMKLHLVKSDDSPTILKEKIVEIGDNRKLLGIYQFNDGVVENKSLIKFTKIVFEQIKRNQIVIISDYGHGLISKQLAKAIIIKKKKDLFVNTQLNAANLGYHTIGKYKNSSCAVINEVELRHEMRNRHQELKSLLPILSKKLNIKKLIVTAGAKGSYGFNKESGSFYYCPAFTTHYKDKIGAGDCYMGVFSVIYKIYDKDIELAMFIASLATVDILEGYGSEFVVDKIKLKKRILYTLK